MENFTFLHFLFEMFCQTCCHHMSMKPAASSVISVPIYQITLHHSPESGDHSIHCCDNSNLILHTAISAKLTQILGQFLQTLLFVQTGNAEQTATWNTVQHLQSQTDDNTSNSTLQSCYLSLTHWLSHEWQLTHGRLVRFRAQVHQAAGFHQECNPHLQLPSWFIFLLPRFTLQLIPSEKHISMLRRESDGLQLNGLIWHTTLDNDDNNDDDDESSKHFQSTRWFKYDRDWFVCKQAAVSPGHICV